MLVSELGDALIPSDVVQFSGDDAVLLEFCGRDLEDPRSVHINSIFRSSLCTQFVPCKRHSFFSL